MKTLYFDCPMGAAGDMLCAALYAVCPNKENAIELINSAGIPHVITVVEERKKCGISGFGFSVKIFGHEEESKHHHEHSHHNHHHHNTLGNIIDLINKLNISDNVKKQACDIYGIIADAESKVHNCTIDNIHFHEVGTLDAVADVVNFCILAELIGADRVVTSAINVGGGTVKCAHGILPVPAPATAEILKGMPFYISDGFGELCTPTGAAILKYFTNEFSALNSSNIIAVGYGMGKKDFDIANCVRAFVADTQESDTVFELSCNIDDMTGEHLAFAVQKLLDKGALDVYTTAIMMKKGRNAVMLTCLCRPGEINKFAELIFKYTTTIGVRYSKADRFVLKRRSDTVDTKYGKVRVKRSDGFGVSRIKPEYDDITKIADEKNLSINSVLTEINM